MNRVIHLEIHAADPERAAEFYRDVFGWDINEWIVPGVEMPKENRYWLVTTGSEKELGINGGILFRRGATPAEGQPVWAGSTNRRCGFDSSEGRSRSSL